MSGKQEEGVSAEDVATFMSEARAGTAEGVTKLADAAGVNAVGTTFVEQRQRTTTALYEAVDTGNMETVSALLEVPGIDVNAQPTKFHRTALGLAADLGDVGIVSALLAVDGVDVNAGADGLGSPLVLACIKGRAAVVALLLERADVDVNQLSRNKVPPLTGALRLGHDETVVLLLQDERVDVAQLTADDDPVSAFALACRRNLTATVRTLLDSGRFDVAAEVEKFDLMTMAKDRGFQELFDMLDEHFLVAKTFEELEPERQAAKMRYVFRKYDTTNSGFITPAKLGLLARDLGVELDDAELREAAVGLDTNRNGLIEFEELVAYWTH